MKTWYNRIAGHSTERLAALSDGIFAVAMTLLVLDLPQRKKAHKPGDNLRRHGAHASLGGVLFLSWRCAVSGGLIKAETTDEVGRAILRRILVAQALYAAGAALCFVNTYASIAVIVIVQLNFAFAPRLGRFSRF